MSVKESSDKVHGNVEGTAGTKSVVRDRSKLSCIPCLTVFRTKPQGLQQFIHTCHDTRNPVLSLLNEKLPAQAHRSYRHVHGMCQLPLGYSLVEVSINAKISSDHADKPGRIKLCSSYSLPKSIIAIVQTIYASVTLYHTRGNQIQQYGYAAFGLTVLPYIMMSIINLIATLLIPYYPTLYIVGSLELDEAMALGAKVEGIVGRMVQDSDEDRVFLERNQRALDTVKSGKKSVLSITHADSSRPLTCYPPVGSRTIRDESFPFLHGYLACGIAILCFGAVPIAVIGIWTHFNPSKSTLAQRFWTMSWLGVDIFYGSIVDLVSDRNLEKFLSEVNNEGAKKVSEFINNVPKFFSEVNDAGAKKVSEFMKKIPKVYSRMLIDRFTKPPTEEIPSNVAMVVYIAPAIGGFVVVGQMLQAYGSCTEVLGINL